MIPNTWKKIVIIDSDFVGKSTIRHQVRFIALLLEYNEGSTTTWVRYRWNAPNPHDMLRFLLQLFTLSMK